MTLNEFISSRHQFHGPIHPTDAQFTAQFNLVDTRVGSQPADGLYTTDDVNYFFQYYDLDGM